MGYRFAPGNSYYYSLRIPIIYSLQYFHNFQFSLSNSMAVCIRKNSNRFRPKFVGRAEFPPTPLPPARRSDPFGLDDFKFFVPLLAELRASLGLAANSFYRYDQSLKPFVKSFTIVFSPKMPTPRNSTSSKFLFPSDC